MRLIFENRAKAGDNIAKSRWNLITGKGLQSDSAAQVGEVDFYTAFDLSKHYFPNFERRARDLAHESFSSFIWGPRTAHISVCISVLIKRRGHRRRESIPLPKRFFE
jgi:hypothetical protein